MPAKDLATDPCDLARYDVLAQRAPASRFIRHLALIEQDHPGAGGGVRVPATHMSPPFRIGEDLDVDAMGSVPLSRDETRAMETWISGMNDEYSRQSFSDDGEQYTAHPAWEDVRSGANQGVVRYRRYSCAGFVVDAYREVGIALLPMARDRHGTHLDESRLPLVSRATVARNYPAATRYPELLERWGLRGPGPWPVLLPGYVLHALDRAESEIRSGPYTPAEGDAEF